MLQQTGDSFKDFPGCWQDMERRPTKSKLPKQNQAGNERDGAETDSQAFGPLSFLGSSGLYVRAKESA